MQNKGILAAVVFVAMAGMIYQLFRQSASADVSGGKPLHTLKGGAALAFSPDGKTLATGGFKEIRFWDTQTWELVKTLKGHSASIITLTYSANGEMVASASNPFKDGDHIARRSGIGVNVWDVKTGALKHTLLGHKSVIFTAAFSNDGKSLATGGDDKTIKIWDITTGKLKQTLRGHCEMVLALAYSPDDKTLASGGVLELKLWDTQTGKLKKSLPGIDESVRALAFQDKTLVSINQDGKIRHWDTETSKLKQIVKTGFMLTSVDLTRDGKFYASGGGSTEAEERPFGNVRVQNAETGKVTCGVSFKGGFESLAISPDGKMFAVGGSDGEGGGSVDIWKVK